MNKSLLTNLIAAGVFIISYLSPDFPGQKMLVQASLFALSGALTNWLAIHMLFEKVPGLYGSGIVPERFEEFKTGIRTLIMDNFFTRANFSKVAETTIPHEIPSAVVLDAIDFSQIFDGFVKVVEESPLGGMLKMFGSTEVLAPLQEPFRVEFEKQLTEILGKIDLAEILQSSDNVDHFQQKIEFMVDSRLNKLSPQEVKHIVEDMIYIHLGWLVVWGGVFGAVIGIISSLLV